MIKDEMIDANVVANYFLTKSELTPKKLQKLVYYSYSWFIALNNENENEINSLLSILKTLIFCSFTTICVFILSLFIIHVLSIF